ncbi:cellular retinaldehyde-binding protein [Culex quinquefasciatus]|uniref:Cellular retinaldehyde-binding protein n=1 Tax=Culex quinquefasciatus TaxID=7176 RepID=B0X3T3_CULQU|nr:cellular retinaldehyde-binding protein [Culex quinquefasciatus]|eukprot:XP_001864305.1 cellular retinaldehyde-binding protein [Culex quinquefasciatus]
MSFELDVGPPSAEVLEVARQELRETPEVRVAAILELRKLLQAATDLSFPDDDDFLVAFLRPSHFYVDSALKLMRNLAEFLKTHNDIKNVLPVDLKDEICNYNLVTVLTNRDQRGRRMVVVHMGEIWDPKAVSEDKIFAILYTIHKLAVMEQTTQINGAVVLYDFEGLGMKQVKGMSPGGTKRLLSFIQEAAPLRIKGVHFVKEPMLFNMVWALMKPFVNDKLKKRMYFHGSDMKKLHAHVNADCLPANYGGTLPALNYGSKDWYPTMEKHSDFIKKFNSAGFK